MAGEVLAPERGFLAWCLQQSPVPDRKLATLRPNFLIISPPKTGSTWLADNLRCHPEIFIPAIKELKYFSSWFQWLDLNWYLDQFVAGAGRVKGEASPSYSLLPVERIRLIRGLMPDVKLIFLMRDPVARAWSHAKHNYRYREANFASSAANLEAVTDDQWCENFAHDWPLASGDYLGQLRRWLSVFPREQMYVGFYESIATCPERLLRDLFAFLGVDPQVDLSTYPLLERILPGLPAALPGTHQEFLQQLLGDRTQELERFVREQFGLQVPPEWNASLTTDGSSQPCPMVPQWEFDDLHLGRLLEQEGGFPSASHLALGEHRGYSLVFYRERFYALDQALGTVHLPEMSAGELQRYEDCGSCLSAPSVTEVKDLVTQQLLARMQRKLAAIDPLRAELQATRERIAQLEESLRDCVNDPYRSGRDGREALAQAVLRIVTDALPIYRWRLAAVQFLRKIWWRMSRRPQGRLETSPGEVAFGPR